ESTPKTLSNSRQSPVLLPERVLDIIPCRRHYGKAEPALGNGAQDTEITRNPAMRREVMAIAMTAEGRGQKTSALSNPWLPLVFGILCMATIANLHDAWPLFRGPIVNNFSWNPPAVEISFTIFLVVQTWLVPLEGVFIDKYGSRPLVIVGGALCGLSWVLYSEMSSLAMLYLAACTGGIGAGCVYGACVANALKWFPTKRGLAVGLTAAGYGAGAALTVGPVANMIKTQGYHEAFMFFGLFQGAIVVLM